MSLSFSFPRALSFPRVRVVDLFTLLLFSYFLTLHADQLNVVIGPYTIRINNLIACVLAIALFFQVRVIRVHRGLLLGLGGLSLSLLLSLAMSPYRLRCFFFLGWYGLTICCYFLLPYLLLHLFDVRKVMRAYFGAFLCTGTIACGQWLLSLCGLPVPFADQEFGTHFVRPNAFAYEPSFYALYMTPFVVLAQLHYLTRKEKDFFIFKRLTKKHLVVIHFLYLISTATSTIFAYFIFLLVLALFWLFTSWRKQVPALGKGLWKWGGILCAILGLLWVVFPTVSKTFYFKFFILDFQSHHSFFERWAGIINAWAVFRCHPICGVGLGGIPSALYEAWLQGDSSYLFIFQDRLIFDCNRILKLFEPSNVCTELLGSLGIIGLLAFGFFFFHYFHLVKKAYQKHTDSPLLRHWVFLFCITLIVTLLVLQFNQGLFRTYVWVHIALAFAFTEKSLLAGETILLRQEV